MKTKLKLIILFFITFNYMVEAKTHAIFVPKSIYNTRYVTQKETLSIPNAKKILVRITGEAKKNRDELIISNSQGKLIKKFEGDIREDFIIDASSIQVELKSKPLPVSSSFSISSIGIFVEIIAINDGLIAATKWTSGTYANNANITKHLYMLNKNRLIVSVKGELEEGYDKLYITSNFGGNSQSFTGKIDTEFTVGASAISINLKSDDSIRKSGVTVSIREDKDMQEDIQKPVITLIGDAEITLSVGDTYIDAGATAYDNRDGNISSRIEAINIVDTSTPGIYYVDYNVADEAGNMAEETTRMVVVK